MVEIYIRKGSAPGKIVGMEFLDEFPLESEKAILRLFQVTVAGEHNIDRRLLLWWLSLRRRGRLFLLLLIDPFYFFAQFLHKRVVDGFDVRPERLRLLLPPRGRAVDFLSGELLEENPVRFL